MLGPILLGFVAAVFAALPPALTQAHRSFPWTSPYPILGIAAAAMLIQHFVLDRRPGYRGYDGLADLFVDIHTPSGGNSSVRWAFRGLITLLLSIFGGAAGPEGAGVELAQAFATGARGRAARWFEQRRRSDAACSLAAGFAAAFWAPFAGLLIPIEMGIGGRAGSIAISAITAYLVSRGISMVTLSRPYDFGGVVLGFKLRGVVEIGMAAGVAIACGVLGAAIVRFVRFFQESLLDLFQTQTWMRILAGGVLLCLVTLVHNPGHLPGSVIVERMLWGQGTAQEVGLLIATRILILAAVVSGFGTIGLFWPLFAIGCLSGFEIHALWTGHPGGTPLPVALTLIGGTALWSAVFGTPLGAAVAAFELGLNPEVLLPCYLAGLVALQIRRWLKTPALFDKDLEARGLALLDGKCLHVLESLYVRDAMVTDHETVQEQEAVAELYAKILKSRYPFLPVVNAKGEYVGLLTIDMVQEAYQAAGAADEENKRVSLGKLLEAKDLLYRTQGSVPVVRSTERLSATAGMFEGTPSIPVISEEGRVMGLLFAYSVRVAYDREVARRSLVFESTEISP